MLPGALVAALLGARSTQSFGLQKVTLLDTLTVGPTT